MITPAQSHTKAADDEIEIGYWIGVPYWGQGLIPEAVRALQKHAFLDLGCSAMWCGYYDGNEKSKRCQDTSHKNISYTILSNVSVRQIQACRTDPKELGEFFIKSNAVYLKKAFSEQKNGTIS